MSNKLFSERLNKELDNIGVPQRSEDRIEAFARLVKIPKFKAEAFLNGIAMPNDQVLLQVASELELDPEWLTGKTEFKHKKDKED